MDMSFQKEREFMALDDGPEVWSHLFRMNNIPKKKKENRI